MNVIQYYMTKSPYWAKNQNPTDWRYIAYQKLKKRKKMLHSVGCNQDNPKEAADHWNRPDFDAACVHGFIGANGDVYQTMPWNYRAPHCGGSGNDSYIGVEMCEPPRSILYYPDPDHSSRVVIVNRAAALEFVSRTYRTAVELFAYLCELDGTDPMEDGMIVSHAEGHQRGIASNHGDPEHLWQQLGTGYTMRGFRLDVADLMRKHQAELDASKPEPTGDAHSPYAHDAVEWCKAIGLFLGDGKGNYSWRLPLDREAAATIIQRYAEKMGMDVSGRADLSGFDDQAKVSDYAKAAVSWAVATGLLTGITPTTLAPAENCTRAQFVTILWRLAGCQKTVLKSHFEDVHEEAFYAKAVAWAYAKDIVNGVTESTFVPNAPITREQAATAVYRLMNWCETPRV